MPDSFPLPSPAQPSALAKHLRQRITEDRALRYLLGPGSRSWELLASELGGHEALTAYIRAHETAIPTGFDFMSVFGRMFSIAAHYETAELASFLLTLLEDHPTVKAAFAVLWSQR